MRTSPGTPAQASRHARFHRHAPDSAVRAVAGIACVLLLAACGHGAPPPPALATSTAPAPSTPPAASSSLLAPVMRAVIQGDMVTALEGLRAAPHDALVPKDAAMRTCMLSRFGPAGVDAPVAGLPPAAAEVVKAYRRYWRRIMLRQATTAEAEQQLLDTLNGILAAHGAATHDRTSLMAATDAVKPLLEKRGLHVLTGVTAPFYELMLWREETETRYEVALPERPVTVTVVFMKDFAVKGWLSHATCDRSGAGGWAAKDRLFAVGESYDLASEEFKVSYLAHEGQHFADDKDYPSLESAELEYRAKLTELVNSGTITRRLFTGFANGGTHGRQAPHAHAEYWLVRNLREHWQRSGHAGTPTEDPQSMPDAAIRGTALALLQESSAMLKRTGASTTKYFLPD